MNRGVYCIGKNQKRAHPTQNPRQVGQLNSVCIIVFDIYLSKNLCKKSNICSKTTIFVIEILKKMNIINSIIIYFCNF